MSHQLRRFRAEACRLFTNSDTVISVFARNYSRKTNRKVSIDPRRNVQYPYVQGDPLHEEVIRDSSSDNPLAKMKNKNKEIDNKTRLHLEKQNMFSVAFGLKFEKLMEGDIRLGKALMNAKSNRSLTSNDTILLEGQRLIKDSLLLGAAPKSIYFCDPEVLKDLPAHLLKDIGLYKISYRDMKVWSDTVTPSGILGIFQKPQQGEAVTMPETTLPISLIFDGMKDPGNVGTLIRTAAAVGCERIISTKGTVNAWDCKVLRSAMGGHFTVPIYTGVDWSDIPNYVGSEAHVYLANTRQSCMLAKTFDKRLQSEDLDTALDAGSSSDSHSDSDSDEEEDNTFNFAAERNARQFKNVPLPMIDYADIKLSRDSRSSAERKSPHVALVLGGETEGLSAQAKQFAYSYYGRYVSIPMDNAVNSLNTGIAGSIILYELRKKLLAVKSRE